MRSYWSNMPMLRIALALMVGIGMAIVAGEQKPLHWAMMSLLSASLVVTVLYSHLKTQDLAYKFRICNGLALVAMIISFGYVLSWFNIQKNCESHFSGFLGQKNILVGRIDEPPVIRDKTIQAVVEVEEVYTAKGNIKAAGKIQLNLVKDSLSEELNYGDVVLFNSRVDSIEGPKNPGEFSYKRYLGLHQIYHQAYLKDGNWKLVDTAQGNSLMAFVYKIRNDFLQIIQQYVKDKNDFGVASAIMLGYRDYINADIMRAYASSGTIHVLSVSGLHVGIMFFMLNFLFKWMDGRGKKFEIAKAIIIILFIWFYACLTGMSPPVLRSAMMFSLIQIGRVLNRNVNIYNVIAGSAIFLMLLDPFVLADAGFELSYLAVIGIVYLYPKISTLIVIKIPNATYKKQKNIFYKPVAFLLYDLKWLLLKFCDWTWQLVAVSIAAQIATLPISIFYFYQFPNMFLVSNLVVIPLSNLVLFTGTALFAFGHVAYLNTATGWLFKTLLQGLDSFIFGIDRLPFALTRGISVGIMEVVMMYAFIMLVCWLTEEKRPKVLLASLLIFVGLCSFNSYQSINNLKRKEIVVYSVPKERAILFISGKEAWCDFDTSLLNDNYAMNFHVRHHWANCGLETETCIDSAVDICKQFDFGKLALFEGKKILIVNSTITGSGFDGAQKMKVDLVIISGKAKGSLEGLRKMFDFNEIVFDSSNKEGKIKQWKADCVKAGVGFWDVGVQGAYVKTIEN